LSGDGDRNLNSGRAKLLLSELYMALLTRVGVILRLGIILSMRVVLRVGPRRLSFVVVPSVTVLFTRATLEHEKRKR
jgi:hypothetical protein